ncbi:hypothetical protein OQA88_8762 [Cercophora sp. LCS_1]
MLPVARNKRFFGRHEVLDQLDHYLRTEATSQCLSSVAAVPVDLSIEVGEFGVEDGATFLLHLTRRRKRASGEGWSIQEFEAMYSKHKHTLHRQKKSGGTYVGYQHRFDTVWDMSFRNPGPAARACLGILSFFRANSIPSDVFTVGESIVTPSSAIYDNDVSGSLATFLCTAKTAFYACSADQRDDRTLAYLQSLWAMYYLSSSEFAKAEKELTDSPDLCHELSLPTSNSQSKAPFCVEEAQPQNNLSVALAYNLLSMAVSSQGRFEEGLDFLLKAGNILNTLPTRRRQTPHRESQSHPRGIRAS